MSEQNLFRYLPKVDEVLSSPGVQALEKIHPRRILLDCVQSAIEKLREDVRAGKIKEEKLKGFSSGDAMLSRIDSELVEFNRNRYTRAVNATGVILHTGLGRAPIGRLPSFAAKETAGYCLLEIDRKSGERGLRDLGIERLLKVLTGCEAAAAVNNNAAATLLAVHSFAKGKEVLVSRGELVEIGGSYRMPEVMKIGGAKLVEVGTTNRTRIEDYRNAITPKTSLLLKVHSSNFRIEGFTESASLGDLVALGREMKIPVVHDLGSGLLFSKPLPGVESEPRVQESLRAGVDLVTFSGDKLLGGPQSGILLGKKEAVARIRKNAMFRAMRLSKQVIAMLESTLEIYLRGDDAAVVEIPTLRMLSMAIADLEKKADSLAQGIRSLKLAGLEVSVEDGFSEVGSGSAPGVQVPSKVVSLRHEKLKPAKLAEKLRLSTPPVFSRIQDNRVLLDPRTLVEGDESFIIASLSQLQ